jgi:hypothetical protein
MKLTRYTDYALRVLLYLERGLIGYARFPRWRVPMRSRKTI